MSRVQALLACCSVLVFLSACGADGSGQSRESSDGKPSSDPSPTQRSLNLKEVSWVKLSAWGRTDPENAIGAYDGTNLLLYGLDESNNDVGKVLRGNEKLAQHAAGPGEWYIQEAWLDGKTAAFMDIDVASRTAALRVLDVRRPEAAPRDLAAANPEAAAADGFLSYFVGSVDSELCVRVLELPELTQALRECAGPKAILGDPSLGAGRLLYSNLVHWNSEEKRCKTLHVVEVETGKHDRSAEKEIADHAGCNAWSGDLGEGWVAWDEADPRTPSLGSGQLFVRMSDGQVIELGEVSTDSAVSCGGFLFWHTPSEPERLMAWRPGMEPSLARRPEAERIHTAAACTDDTWLTLRSDDNDGEDERLVLWALDVSSLG